MIQRELEKIVVEERHKGSRPEYIRNLLKEYLQSYVLFFIYTSSPYNKEFIFTGGTCLRHFYGLERLSEDVDFDYSGDLDASVFMTGLNDFFVKRYKYSNVQLSLKQQGRQLLLKFPVLQDLALAYAGGSALLHVKIDVSPVPSQNYTAVVSSHSRHGFNYAARHYDLPDLMAGKLHAILKRQVLKEKNDRESIKGRDYYDLLWFVKKGVSPNLLRLSDMLGEKISIEGLLLKLKQKVSELSRHVSDFRADILPLVRNREAVELYVDNFEDEFLRALRDLGW